MSNPPSPRHAVGMAARKLNIRRAVEGDLADLVALENQSFSGDRLSARQWARHLDSDSAMILVALGERHLIGALVLFFRRGNDIARLYSLAIAAESRGLGLGNSLLEAGERAARRRACRRMRLEVRADNAAARRVYERRGFRVIGERKAYYEDGEDAIRYEKTFDPA